MSTATIEQPRQATSPSENAALEYRALYSGAIISALFGVMSLFMLAVTEFFELAAQVAMIPIAGIIVSLFALKKIRANRDIYTGAPLAIFGLVMSAFMLAWGLGHAGYVYATEVPDGYERISFLTLKPDQKDAEAGRPVPIEAIELLGEPVFIKGYIRPGTIVPGPGKQEFLLVRDNNNCCFGDLQSVKYFDQVLVHLKAPLRAEDNLQVTRIGGRLVCTPQNLGRGPQYPVYHLDADYIE